MQAETITRPKPELPSDVFQFRDVVRGDQAPDESSTTLSPWMVTGDNWAARFATGLQLPDVWCAWHHDPAADGVHTRLWVATTDATSWAAVDYDGQHETGSPSGSSAPAGCGPTCGRPTTGGSGPASQGLQRSA